MTSNRDKLNIVIIIIIIIILCFCIGKQRENFFTAGRNNFNLSDSRLTYFFCARSKCNDKENLYFLASIDLSVDRYLYFLTPALKLINLKIKNMDIEDIIPKITFKVKFYEGTNKFNLQEVDLKPDGDTIPSGKYIRELHNLRFIPYKFIPNSRMGIKSGVKYFMIKHNNDMKFLERNNKNTKAHFRWATSLSAKHKHIFFFIPYYSDSGIRGTSVAQGINSIWKHFS